jgi:hypothetical protein
MSDQLPAKQQKFQLPKIEDLYAEVELASKYNDLNKILNMPPKPEWVKLNPFADNAPYIPIERIEYLLTSIYIRWWVEIKEVKLIANSVSVTIRLYVIDPVTGDTIWQDGTGASPLQTAKGAGAIEFDKIKGAAVQMGAPAAESYAIKDAAEKFGKIFGKDLGRKDEINYAPMQEAKFKDLPPSVIPVELAVVISEADAESLDQLIAANPEYHNLPSFKESVVNRRAMLKKFAL